MTTDELREAILRTVGHIAPEADLGAIDAARDLRDQLDIDSVDFLNVIVAIHDELGVDIPEADYPKVATLGGFVAYLAAKMAR